MHVKLFTCISAEKLTETVLSPYLGISICERVSYQHQKTRKDSWNLFGKPGAGSMGLIYSHEYYNNKDHFDSFVRERKAVYSYQE